MKVVPIHERVDNKIDADPPSSSLSSSCDDDPNSPD